jgi:hypothetical protein
MEAAIGFRILTADEPFSEMMFGWGDQADWPDCAGTEKTAPACAENVALWAISTARQNLWAQWFGLTSSARVVVQITAATACAGLFEVRLQRSLTAAARRLA